MKSLPRIAKIIFAIPFAIFGIFHFMKGPEMAGMLQDWPAAEIFVYLSGAGLFLAAIAIIINKMAKLASLLLAVELLIFILVIHVPSLGGENMQMVMTNMLKDFALMGGALLVAGTSEN